tara:strand:+ start:698 stop:1522 length:825 start_codon:yes stop_codon:yes gene_type:complete
MTSYKKRNYKSKKGKKGRKTRKMQMKEVYLRKKGGIKKEYVNIGKGNPWRLDPTLRQLIECEEYIILIDNPGPKNDYTYGVEPGIGKQIMNKKLFLNIIDSLSREDDKKSVHKHFGMHRIFMILKDDTGYCCSKNSKRSEGKGDTKRSEEKGYKKDSKGEKKSYKGGSEQEFENDGEEVDVAEAKGSENPKTEEETIIEGGDASASCNITYLKCNDDQPIAEWIKDMHAGDANKFVEKFYDTTYGNTEQKIIDTRLSDINSLKNIMSLKTVYYR